MDSFMYTYRTCSSRDSSWKYAPVHLGRADSSKKRLRRESEKKPNITYGASKFYGTMRFV